MDKNNFDFDKTFNELYKIAKQQFKDVDDHFIKISIYGYIYSDLLGEKLENENNEEYMKAQKEYRIKEYDNEDTLIRKACDITGDTTFNLNCFEKLSC